MGGDGFEGTEPAESGQQGEEQLGALEMDEGERGGAEESVELEVERGSRMR